MTNEEAMTHAKALQEFCRDTDCRQCPFGKPSEIRKGIIICDITDHEEPPCGWKLEEEE